MKKITLLLVFLLLCLNISEVRAASTSNRSSISPYFGGVLFDDDLAVDNQPVYGLRFGHDYTDSFGVEAVIEYIDTEYKPNGGDAYYLGYRLEGLYNLTPENDFVPFLAVGVGGMHLNYPAGTDNSNELVADYGAGFKYFFSDNVALRGDVRHLIVVDEIKNNLLYTIGLSFYFGEKEVYDSDNDGIADADDNCPDTAVGVLVDYKGCPADSDNDGIANNQDDCPGTPGGVQVTSSGCPVDSDNDMVADYLDKCPETPTIAKVDAQGCPLDSDKDKVADYLDKCPDTPTIAKVDIQGCPLDSDKDKVADYQDKCADTPLGLKVDAAGCPKKVSISLNVKFDKDKTEIKSEYHAEIKKVADVMKKIPRIDVTVEGHTDNSGPEEYNRKLSQARADSVKKYLVENFGIDENRIKTKGYGPQVPVADNSTSLGQQQNRRVEAVIETQLMVTDFAF